MNVHLFNQRVRCSPIKRTHPHVKVISMAEEAEQALITKPFSDCLEKFQHKDF